jgi:hypothetical protein
MLSALSGERNSIQVTLCASPTWDACPRGATWPA